MNKRRHRSRRISGSRRLNSQIKSPSSPSSKIPKKGIVFGITLVIVASVFAVSAGYIHQFQLKMTTAKGGVKSQSVASTDASVPVQISKPTSSPTDNMKIASAMAQLNQSPDADFLATNYPDEKPSAEPSPVRQTPSVKRTVSSQQSRTTAKEPTFDHKSLKTERLTVERQRRVAERKRSQLESQYQHHEITDQAYKAGQEEYKKIIANYRRVMSGTGSAQD
jgi:hypothetical protein